MSDRPLSALRELTLLRIRTFLREPEAIFWTFGFPIIMAIGLGLAFGDARPEPVRVIVETGSVAEPLVPILRDADDLLVEVRDPTAAELARRRGETDLVVGGTDTLTFRFDPARAEARTARLQLDRIIQESAGAVRPVPIHEEPRRQPGARYIDWVIPGLIGLNLMSTGLWGIGFYIVDSRQKKQLKRLVATPMRRREFLLSQILARLAFVLLEVPPIILFAWLAFGVRVEGSLLELGLVVVLGAMTFAGLGLLASARARTIEGISGIMNVIMLPMFVLSGVFFSTARFPDAMQPFIRALPLTALNDAMRTIYNEGLSLAFTTGPLAILAAWMVVCFLLALRWFRWQ
jgi:ABC-2 type transport system permease protein